MTQQTVFPVVLCGGSGTRLWPRSRLKKPKPFMQVNGGATLFAQTLARCEAGDLFGAVTVVTGEPCGGHVESELSGQSSVQVIVEPVARNTAAAIALAALGLPDDAIMLVCPSDHHVSDVSAFHAAVAKAAVLAEKGWIVSLGVEATQAQTGYGYIEKGAPISDLGFQILRFVEKPDRATAELFLASGNHFWNSGIFVFRAGTFLAELAAHRPDIASLSGLAVASGHSEGRYFYPDAGAFAAIAGESVDYAVMENTQKAALVPVAMGWSDVGSWEMLQDALPHDQSGNFVRGDAELIECRKVMVDSDGPHVSVIGLEGVIIVVDGGNVLVTSRDGAKKVGQLKGAASQ